jgi:hypothetical protein
VLRHKLTSRRLCWSTSGGYCGVSKIENNLVNIFISSKYETFKQHKSRRSERMVCENPKLAEILKML